MIIDGRLIAQDITTNTKNRAEKLTHPPRVVAIVVNQTSVTRSYISIKKKRATEAGCVFEEVSFGDEASTDLLRTFITHSQADAVIVQLPLPSSIDTEKVCNAIPIAKDADMLSVASRAALGKDTDVLLPPVVGAVHEILERNLVVVPGKKVVIVGEGWLVGKPCAIWFRQQGAVVAVVTLESGNLQTALADADIIVSGAGSPKLITPDMVRQGVVLIDAGASESNGVIVGDADSLCAEKCSVFTPVPGGVGPIAVAKLFENAVKLSEKTMNK